MLDRLETELLLHILSFLPSPDVVASSPVHDTTLYKLCLVSKRLRDVAQPFLWRAVAIKSPSQMTAVANKTAMLREHIRVLSIEVGRGEGDMAMAMDLVGLLPSLTDIRLASSFRFLRGGEAVLVRFSALSGKLSRPAVVFDPH
jgi:hypothetical protein